MPTSNPNSIVDYLNTQGQKSDFASRSALAKSKGINDYSGTAEQNLKLLGILKTPKPTSSATPTPSGGPNIVTPPPMPTVAPPAVHTSQPAQQVVNNAQQTVQNVDNTLSLKDKTKKTLQDVEELDADVLTEYDRVSKEISDIKTGVTPLTAAEQAQIDEIQATYDKAVKEQEKANKIYEGNVSVIGTRSGRQRYAPDLYAAEVHTSIQLGIDKIKDLEAEASREVIKMKQSILDNKVKDIQSSYDNYLKAIKEKKQGILDLQKVVLDYQQELRQQNEQYLTADIKNYKYAVQSGGFTGSFTQWQNQQKGGVSSGGLSLTQQDIGEGAQNLNSSRGPDGFADPNLYLQMYNFWQQNGGNVADFLKTYPPKFYVNPTNTFLPGVIMNELKGGQGA